MHQWPQVVRLALTDWLNARRRTDEICPQNTHENSPFKYATKMLLQSPLFSPYPTPRSYCSKTAQKMDRNPYAYPGKDKFDLPINSTSSPANLQWNARSPWVKISAISPGIILSFVGPPQHHKYSLVSLRELALAEHLLQNDSPNHLESAPNFSPRVTLEVHQT